MFQGKVKAALRLLSSNPRGNFLPLNATVGNGTVLDKLKRKHPAPYPINYDSLVNPQFPHSETCHEVIFEELDGVVICNSCLRTDEAAGLSGIDATGFRHMCTSFQSVSNGLCDSLALASVARWIASSYVDSLGLSSLLACCLLTLDKNPGVHPSLFQKLFFLFGRLIFWRQQAICNFVQVKKLVVKLLFIPCIAFFILLLPRLFYLLMPPMFLIP